MSLFERLPIKSRLLVTVLAASIIGIVLMSGILVAYDRYAAKDAMAREMGVLARIIADRSTAALSFNDTRLAKENLQALSAQPIVRLACIYTATDTVFAVYHSANMPDQQCPTDATHMPGYRFTEDSLLIAEPVMLDENRIGSLFIKLSLENIQARLIRLVQVIVVISIIAAIIILILANWLQRPITKPLLHLTAIAKKIANDKEYSVRAVKEGEDELGLLVDAFNGMLDQIALREGERDKAESELRAHREHLEELVLERTEDLRKANRELEAFSYSVSHDLRTPLRAIEGFSQVIQSDYGETLDEAGKDYLKRIRASSQRMAGLIDDLLDLSRMSRKEMRLEQVDVSSMVKGIVHQLEATDEGRKVSTVIEDGVTAVADGHLLKVALENLIGNAWKYTGRIDNPVITFGKEMKQGKVYYYVRDNGEGFDMQYVGKIFEPFQRLHGPKEFEGSGIGLAIVTRILERHNGGIEAVGEEGKGATFYFTLGTA